MTIPRVARRLRAVNAPTADEIVNPKPCGCCSHGHELATLELVLRRSDGSLLKRLKPVPGGFEEVA